MAAISEAFNAAVTHHGAGRLGEAEQCYRAVLAAVPGHAAALTNLGVLALQTRRFAEALALVSDAIRAGGADAERLWYLGAAHRGLGRATEAIAAFKESLALRSDAARWYDLGNALLRADEAEQAADCYLRAIADNPAYADAYYNLRGIAQSHLPSGTRHRWPAVVKGLETAMARGGARLPEAHHALGVVWMQRGEAAKALAVFERALAQFPLSGDLGCARAEVLAAQGRGQDAVAALLDLVAAQPDHAAGHFRLGRTLMEDLGRPDMALAAFRRCAALKPDNREYWENLGICASRAAPEHYDPALAETLSELLDRQVIRPELVVDGMWRLLLRHPVVTELIAGSPGIRSFDRVAADLSAIPLLLRAMTAATVADPALEGAFTALRRAMLSAMPEIAPEALPVCIALASQCFLNEYIYDEDAEEAGAVAELMVRPHWSVNELVVLAAYRPLCSLPSRQALVATVWPPEVAPLIGLQLLEPLEEEAIAAGIPRLTPIDGEVSRVVQAQYEANPYPRWRDINRPLPRSPRDALDHLPFAADLDERWKRLEPDILIAGCGTGRHAMETALGCRGARVVGIDLSARSLGYAERNRRRLGIGNLELMQADILRLSQLDRGFDIIECCGVLHHLADPLQGWRVLVDRLRPKGLMRIALYSDLARAAVVAARTLIADGGYGVTPDEIRRFRRDLLARRPDLAATLTGTREFFSLSECRDLLFHVQEHRFTIPGIEAALRTLNLEFLGFEPPNAQIAAHYRKRFPADRKMTALASWDRFERDNPASFAGMYVFWAQKRKV